MVRSNVQLRRVLSYLLALTAVLAGGMGCGPTGGGLGGSIDPESLILDDAETLLTVDVGAFLESRELPSAMLGDGEDTEDAQDRFLAEWEGDAGDALLHPDEVSAMIFLTVPGQRGYGGYAIFQGKFAPGDVIEAVEEAGYEEDAYRDFPVWRDESGQDLSIAVFEEDDFFVLGSDDTIKDFLKALDRGEGFASGEHGLRRVLDAAGEGLLRFVSGACGVGAVGSTGGGHDGMLDRLSGWAAETSGCESAALTVTGGDEDTTLLTMAVLFTSERRAESGLEDLEDRMEDSEELDIDVEDARVRGEMAVMELIVHK